jgi:wobble nucleotide-excising tRNase
MINKIDFIKDFGIYKNFNWNSSIDEFKSKNIFYGWNYSGKTTLSRIFSSLRDKQIHEDYLFGDFKLTIGNDTYTKDNLATFPYDVFVFNSDYIKNNLRWDFDKDINAILFEVGQNVKHTERIEKLIKLIEKIEGTEIIIGKKNIFLTQISGFDDFEILFTNESKRIKNDVFSSSIDFTKANFKSIKNKIIDNLFEHLIQDKKEIIRLSKSIKTEKPKEKLEIIVFVSNYNEILRGANEIFSAVPSKESVIKILDNNSKANNWVKSGMHLNNPNEKCLYCDNVISKQRYELLTSYFESEASKVRIQINELLKIIETEENNISSINFPLSLNDFNDGFQDEYNKEKKVFDEKLKGYIKNLIKIKSLLNKKITSSIYKPLPSIIRFDFALIDEKLNKLNNVVIKNNTFTENFSSIINEEREIYKNHLVAFFLKQNNYLLKQEKSEKAKKEITKLNKQISGYNLEIKRLNALRESDEEGCEQLNYFIQSFLSRNDIEIRLNSETKKFNLLREGKLANNLSEGEKMAISFSHFLVTLKSVEKKNELNNCIVFIDDPMSSLDGNHIFQINSLIKDFFFGKAINPDPKQKSLINIVNCKQLFISTHNFEFFNLLKELPISKNSESRYFISREINLENLPKIYNSFESEYQFLFSEIIKFNDDINKNTSSKFLMMPNVLRRFVEMYTLTKYPSGEPLEARADKVFNKMKSKRILKAFHYFSHFDNIDRIGKQSEYLADIPTACSTLVDFIKVEDKNHYEALEKAIN